LFKAVRILILIFIITAVHKIYGQDNIPNNISVLDNIVLKGLNKIYYLPGIDRSRPFVFILKTNDNIAEQNLRRVIIRSGSSENIKISFAGGESIKDSAYNQVEIKQNKLQITYPGFKTNNFLGEKTVNRKAEADLEIVITQMPENNIQKSVIRETSNDAVPLENLAQLEDKQIPFTVSKHPQPGSFEQIIFPVLLITASAAAIILFFTVRTK
jgi:hypothetical protein